MTTTAGNTYQQNLATPFDPNLGYLELTGATRQLINWGIPAETITNLANPDEYAKFYGSQGTSTPCSPPPAWPTPNSAKCR